MGTQHSSLRKRAQFILIATLAIVVITTTTAIAAQYIKRASSQETLSLGRVELDVRNIDTVLPFYANGVGLELLERGETYADLGINNTILVRLVESPALALAPRSEPGLYHLALVFSERSHLSTTLRRTMNIFPSLYEGSSDHSATEAFYFHDPEGNGVELYFDRPRSEWRYTADGKPQMDSKYIDVDQYIQTHINGPRDDLQIRMGHVHLQAGNIEQMRRFYVDVLQFDIITQRADSLFMSRDGYHHHLAVNTWSTAGAGKRRIGYTGLRGYIIHYHDKQLFHAIEQNLQQNNISFERVSNTHITAQDPAGLTVHLTTQ